MSMRHHRGLVALALFVAWGCHTRRQPAVLTPADVEANRARANAAPAERVEGGDEIQPFESDQTSSQNIPGLGEEEGGPLEDIHFDFDQATLSDEAQATLRGHAQWIKSHPLLSVTVEGHCDERGTVEYNIALGEKRARVVFDYLVSLGVPATRLLAVSLGKERPLDPGHDEAAWARNRRAHFAVRR
jgi:peptidoglycan-associated lipoprotein